MKPQIEDYSNVIHNIERIQKKDWFRSYAISANFTINDKDKIKTLFCTTGGSGITVTLPLAANNLDRVIEIFKVDAAIGILSLVPQGADTLNGGAGVNSYVRYTGYRVKSNGTAWFIFDTLMAMEKFFITPIGGHAILLINDTGVPSVKGEFVRVSAAVQEGVIITGVDEDEAIGCFYESGIADGEKTFIVVGGIADILLKDTTAGTMGNWVQTSNVAGRADATNIAPIPPPDHWQEIGHCTETIAPGVNVLCRIIMHFN